MFGRLGADEIDLRALADSRVRRLLGVMTLTEDHELSRRFPAERWARVEIALKNGRIFRSEPTEARGDPENPLSDKELREKFFALTAPVLGQVRAERIEQLVNTLPDDGSLSALLEELLQAAA